MKRAFNFEGPVFTLLSKFADLIWLNLLYIICCLPVITIGAATTAMYYVTLKMAKDEEGYISKAFFKSFKDNFKQATGIWLIYAVILFVLVSDIVITGGGSLTVMFNSEGLSNVLLVIIGVVGIIIIMTLTYVFPILAQFDNSIKNTIRNSFLISIRHLPFTIAMVVISIVPWVIIYMSPAAMLLIFIAFSLVAYINSKFFVKIFKNYMPKEDTEDIDGEVVETVDAEATESL